jgi:hypothetical protein
MQYYITHPFDRRGVVPCPLFYNFGACDGCAGCLVHHPTYPLYRTTEMQLQAVHTIGVLLI